MKSSLRTLNLVASLVLFGIHTPLLFLARGEFTDGVLQTVYFDTPLYVCAQGDSPARYVPPLFPALLYFSSRMGMDPLLAGRLISLVAYAACAFVIGWIGALIGRSLASKCVSDLDPATLDFSSAFVGITAWSFWALSPMANRWAIHCMTDMLFCFLSTTSLACFVASTFRDQRRRNGFWFAGNLWGIAAAWTRYQGLALIAASVFSRILVRKRKRGAPAPPGVEASAFRHSATRKETRVFPAIALLFLWGGTLWLLRSGTGIHQGQFADRAIYPWKLYLDFALAAFQYLPYAVTPPLLLLAMYGIYTAARSGPVAAFWILAGVAGGGAGLVVQTFFLSFQFRYGLPLLPWVCVLAAVGVVSLRRWLRTGACAIAILWLAGMSFAVLFYQHKTFSDIEAVARQVPENLDRGRKVWACERYNDLYQNVKVSVWSGTEVAWLDGDALDRIEEGDLLIHSNVYPIPGGLLTQLRKRWKTVVVVEEFSETVPLFPGEILWISYPYPDGPRMTLATSDPELMRYRYKRQYYSTVLYRIEARKQKQNDDRGI